MYVLPNLVFIAHPRTASRAAAEVLVDLGASEANGHHRLDAAMCQRVIEGGGIVACVARNMFDVMVSWWHNQNHKLGTNSPLNANYKPFDEYLKEKSATEGHKWFLSPVYHYGIKHANMVIEYEDLQDGFNIMLRAAGFPICKLPRIGASKRVHYSKYYTPDLRAIVENRWADDLLLTGHSYETLLR